MTALSIDSARSRVVIETRAAGMFAALAHDLRVLAPVQGALDEGDVCRARFDVRAMRVEQSCRHGTGAWGLPSAGDRAQIEEKIPTEVFRGTSEVRVEATLDGRRASIVVLAGPRRQTLAVDVVVERAEGAVTVRGEAELSLSALGAVQPRVPLGAIKLEDRVRVRFDVRLSPPASAAG
jgi:hypothetical protein